jgi:DNA-binding NtrC family response regulator
MTAKRLLLVEDEATLARALTRLLRRVGYDVHVVGTCDEARKVTGTFSLGIFDIQLPDGDGVGLAKHMVKAGLVRRVVFYSGTVNGLERRRAAKFAAFVEKSAGFPALRAAIVNALESAQVMVAGAEDEPSNPVSSPPPSGIQGNGGGSDLN